jgi:hypothetical protein
MSNLMLDVDQAGELKAAFRRNDWTNGQIKKLCEGDILAKVRLVLEGTAEIVMKSILSVVATTKGKKTADCFTNKTRYYNPDPDLVNWLPPHQPEQSAGEFSVQQLAMPGTFKQAVENFLGITGEISLLAKTLRERGHVTTLPVIESLVERQEAGEDVGLLTDGWVNFFFVFVGEKKEKEDEKPAVLVVYIRRLGSRWRMRLNWLGYGRVLDEGSRFFFRNSGSR